MEKVKKHCILVNLQDEYGIGSGLYGYYDKGHAKDLTIFINFYGIHIENCLSLKKLASLIKNIENKEDIEIIQGKIEEIVSIIIKEALEEDYKC